MTNHLGSFRDHELLFTSILQATPDLLYVYDFDQAKIIYCNAAVQRILGYTPAHIEAMNSSPLALIHPDDREGAAEIYQAFDDLKDGDIIDHSYRMRHADGSYRWLRCRDVVFERHADGAAKRLLGIARDITQDIANQELLQESEQRFKLMANGSPFMIWVVDTEGTLQFANQAYREYFGIASDEIEGVDWQSFLYAEDADSYASAFRSAIALRESWTGEARMRRRDGAWRWIVSYSSCRFSDAGDFLGCVGSSLDITDYKHAEAELQALNASLEERIQARTHELERSQQRFSAAFYGAPFAGCLLTLDTGCFLEVNAAFETLTGYTRDRAVGRTDKELGLWASQHDQQKFQRAITEGDVHELELRIRTKDGAERVISSAARPINEDGSQVLLKMFHDITDRKRSQDQLLKAIEATMQDASWFSRRIVEKLAQLKSEQPSMGEIADLSLREQQVLTQMANGMTNEEISQALNIKEQTVRNYISSIYEKINVHSRAQAVVWARERGMQHFEVET